MSGEERKGPALRRPIGHQDRDRYVDKRSPPGGIPEQTWDEPLTGRVDLTQDEIASLRSRRPTPQRIESLEKWRAEADKRHLDLAVAVGRVDEKVVGVGDKVDTLVGLLTDKGKTERTKISTNGKVLIAIGTAAFAAIAAILKVVLS